MQTVLIVIHLLIVIALVGIILIQRSEGGGLGVSSGSGFMTARGTKNALTRLTAILVTSFFLTSIILTVLPKSSGSDILDKVPESNQGDVLGIKDNILDHLGSSAVEQPQKNNAAVPRNGNVPMLPSQIEIPD
ncbi:MAG: preprotein translocase subunit SecG [Candidatus Tokpelaia sp. JSC189]|nr:MAG: preprotein translocase subunit SecG [Candidatus Tokpelaia sp. JSC189]